VQYGVKQEQMEGKIIKLPVEIFLSGTVVEPWR
jgi:hypothetical protein